jgi:hypothetical protein
MRQYSLEQQFDIFRYGNDRVEPPLLDLAKPIAERGKSVIPFLLTKLKEMKSEDIGTRDVVSIFEEMAFSGSYDVKADAALMQTLSLKVSNMKNRGWQDSCRQMLDRIAHPH